MAVTEVTAFNTVLQNVIRPVLCDRLVALGYDADDADTILPSVDDLRALVRRESLQHRTRYEALEAFRVEIDRRFATFTYWWPWSTLPDWRDGPQERPSAGEGAA